MRVGRCGWVDIVAFWEIRGVDASTGVEIALVDTRRAFVDDICLTYRPFPRVEMINVMALWNRRSFLTRHSTHAGHTQLTNRLLPEKEKRTQCEKYR